LSKKLSLVPSSPGMALLRKVRRSSRFIIGFMGLTISPACRPRVETT
jgi:hypothetical protein